MSSCLFGSAFNYPPPGASLAEEREKNEDLFWRRETNAGENDTSPFEKASS
jgi:hypothetical protein